MGNLRGPREPLRPNIHRDDSGHLIREFVHSNKVSEDILRTLVEVLETVADQINESNQLSRELVTKLDHLRERVGSSMVDGPREQMMMNFIENSLRGIVDSHKHAVRDMMAGMSESAELTLKANMANAVAEYRAAATAYKESAEKYKEGAGSSKTIYILLGVIIFLVVAQAAIFGVKLAMPGIPGVTQ